MDMIRGQRRNLARQLYLRTQHLPFFSVNDLRITHLNKFFKDPRQHGGFFTDLKVDGYITEVGEIKAHHPDAKGRTVKAWEWTYHAKKNLRLPGI